METVTLTPAQYRNTLFDMGTCWVRSLPAMYELVTTGLSDRAK